MKLTAAQFLRIVPRAKSQVDTFLAPLNAAMEEFEIDSHPRMISFLSQTAHESVSFTKLVENMNYGAVGLLGTFGKYFTPEEALAYARQPVRIGNRAYADRMGNGNEASGDGFKYRGRGLIHVTGKNNYIATMMVLNIDCVEYPELLELPVHACRSAGHFWKSHGCNQLADLGDQRAVTKRVNGGYNGLAERLEFFDTARKVLA